MSSQRVRVGFVGAGYIAAWHAEALKAVPGAELAAVCDLSGEAARAIADSHGAKAFTSLDDMLEARVCDAVHVLTPPGVHADVAIKCLGAGLDVLVEKPFATTARDCTAIAEAARASGRIAAVCHNFLGGRSYEKLKSLMSQQRLGRVSSAEFNWRFPLEVMRSGPFGAWMLRSPKNILLELGPHLFAFAVDLFGEPENFQLSVGKPIAIPGSGENYQSWRILARAGEVDLMFNLSLVETAEDRSVFVHGSTAAARLDFGNDTLVVANVNASDIIVNPLRREFSLAGQHLREGLANAVRQLFSLNQAAPYGASFRATLREFYAAVGEHRPVDARFSGESAVKVIAAIEAVAQLLPVPAPAAAPLPSMGTIPQPTILVVGGTGFIGRALTNALVASGKQVRVLSRGRTDIFNLPNSVELVSASLKDPASLRAALAGIEVVYHLGKTSDKTWEACLENDVKPTVLLAEAALAARVRRFVYTGTIASYDMSRPDRPIVEETGFDADMTDRNLYARSKAECEARLLELHRAKGLPLVIARPGIVIGPGGPLQHWGIGRWHGAGAVRVWGSGRNILPFVLIDDVCDALVKIGEGAGDPGTSYNLVGDPMLSARDYFEAVRTRCGARLLVQSSSPAALYALDAFKYVLKKHVLRKSGISRPSLRDWQSRAHLSPFRNDRAKLVLGWQPEADRRAFIERGIVPSALFGF